MLIGITKGFCKEYISGWCQECKDIYKHFRAHENLVTADRLLNKLNKARRNKWIKTMEELNIVFSSQKGCSLFQKLSSGINHNYHCYTEPKRNT